MYLLNSFSALKPKLKPYFLCNSNFNSNYYPITTTTTTTKSSITQMATKVDESNVGIFCFISNLPGFRGILKQRSYSSPKKKKNRGIFKYHLNLESFFILCNQNPILVNGFFSKFFLSTFCFATSYLVANFLVVIIMCMCEKFIANVMLVLIQFYACMRVKNFFPFFCCCWNNL